MERLCYYQIVGAKRIRHAVCSITYHLVWCPKYRRRLLSGPVAERLGQRIRFKVAQLDGESVALEIRPGYVHLFVSFPPTLAVHQIVHGLKGYSSYGLRKDCPWLKNRLPALWTRFSHVATAGDGWAHTMRRSIEPQKGR